MADILCDKILSDGTELSIHKYALSADVAKALNRPTGSYEIVLRWQGKGSAGTTWPKASWYLAESDFKQLYDLIRTKNDFMKVRKFVDEVKSDEDAGKLPEFIEKEMNK